MCAQQKACLPRIMCHTCRANLMLRSEFSENNATAILDSNPPPLCTTKGLFAKDNLFVLTLALIVVRTVHPSSSGFLPAGSRGSWKTLTSQTFTSTLTQAKEMDTSWLALKQDCFYP